MSKTHEHSGRCLCGAVQLSIAVVPDHLGACHCAMCRKWGGGPFLAIDCGTDVQIDGEQHVTVFDSSEWAERGFCSKCGTHLFYRLKDTQQYMLPIGLLDDDPQVVFNSQIFIDEKPGYYSFANETENMTGAEVFAKFGAPEEGGG